jgi:hypothetical protein
MANLIIDTQLLLLFVVGATRRSYIGKHKRLRAYSEADFDLLLEVISDYENVVVTPNTLTETSNLLGYKIQEPMRSEVFTVFGAIIQNTDEIYVESRALCGHKEFVTLGLTDAALHDLSDDRNILLTADLNLYLAAAKNGAVNFHYLRVERGII